MYPSLSRPETLTRDGTETRRPCSIPSQRRGIYVLPNLFTTAALFCGFFCHRPGDGDFEQAAVAIFIAMVLDGLDGRVARLTHTQSAFGRNTIPCRTW